MPAAWLGLTPGQDLYLEVARDYAVAAENALKAVEVKDTAGTAITINSENVRDALDAFVDLVERNPERKIQLHFLTTSSIGRERENSDRAGGEPTLQYWRRAAAGADIEPLREILARTDLTQRVRTFITARDDTALREELLRRIHWDCGKPDLAGMAEELGSGLVRMGVEKLRALPDEKDRMLGCVLLALLNAILKAGPRRLTDADLLETLGKATSVTLRRPDFDALMRSATESLAARNAYAVQATLAATVLEPEGDLPLPEILAERTALVSDVLTLTRAHGACFVTGSTGSGKTIVARLAARSQGGAWHIVDCRDLQGDAAIERLNLALGSLDGSRPAGIILDDVNELEDATVRRSTARLLAALRRRDALCVITAYNEPSARTLSELGIAGAAHQAVPDLALGEIAAMVRAAGGDATKWAHVVRLASSFGHPQLVQAVISGLRLRSWPADEWERLQVLERSEDVEAERIAARRRLMAEPPNEPRALLYRLTMVLGRFDRPLAVSLGSIAPPLPTPGAHLDNLIGPWVEQVGHGQMRMSPLVQRAGDEVLAADERQLVHPTIAEHWGSGTAIDIDKADLIFLHALLGKAERILMRLAFSVIAAKRVDRKQLAEWITGLRLHRLDRPIIAENPALSTTLRCAQLLLTAAKGEPERIQKCWLVLQTEIDGIQDDKYRLYLKLLITGKILITEEAASILPNWIDLVLSFEELANRVPVGKKMLAGMSESKKLTSATPISSMFGMQITGTRSVADLATTFSRLNALNPQQRDALFADALAMPQQFSIYVNRAWLSESRLEHPNWAAGANAYRDMAQQAQSWGYRDLALRCHIARAVILDEYADNVPAAEEALGEARDLLGDDPALVRAHAKILFRHDDHASALDFLRRVADEPQLSAPIERAFLAREAGICAAEIGQWAEAQSWFSVAKTAAEASHMSSMDVMAIGLEADGALAALKAGDIKGALMGLDNSLERLAPLDPNSSVATGYCHRVVRHALLCLVGQCTGEHYIINREPATMRPGMCSNTEPPDLSDLPLGSLDYARYLLAQAEIASGHTVGIEERLRDRLNGRSIPAMENFLEYERISRSIRLSDVDAFVAHLPVWIKIQIYMRAHLEVEKSHGVLNPFYGEIAEPSSEELKLPDAVGTAEDAFLSLALAAAIHSRKEVLPLLRSRVDAGVDGCPSTDIVNVLFDGRGSQDRLPEVVAQFIHLMTQRESLAPDELFVAGLRLAEWAKGSNFRLLLAPMLATWTRERWNYVITNQKFYLRTPTSTVPELQTALTSSHTGLAFVGKVLVAASTALGRSLSSQFRDFLLSLPP